jgi:hypothetical protein
MSFVIALWALASVVFPAAQAEPSVTLRVPAFPAAAFQNFSSVLLPDVKIESIDLDLDRTLAQVQASTVRVTLNNIPLTPFVSVNRTPSGARIVIKLGMTLSPDYAIRRDGESILAMEARDTQGTAYRGQFYLTIDPAKTQPELARSTRARSMELTTIAPPQFEAPVVTITSKSPGRTADPVYWLSGSVTDGDGLRRVVIELNGKDVQEVALQNERPIRYVNGRVFRGRAAGEITGNGSRIDLNVPITLAKNKINVIALRAENLRGLVSRADQTIEVFKQ